MLDYNLLKEYAKVAVEIGVRPNKGQRLIINANVEHYEFVRLCVENAYNFGAGEVVVNYSDDFNVRKAYEFQTKETLSTVPNYIIERKRYDVETGVCYLHIISEDPDLLEGIDQEKIKSKQMAYGQALQPFRYYTSSNYGQWSIVAVPNLKWAKKVFPNVSDDEAINKLWDAILYTSRCQIGKSVENWKNHCQQIKNRCKIMNDYNFKTLHFKNSLGTDLYVGLIKDHIWEGGQDIAKNGAYFNPNIPTEEIFTMPNRFDINGIVYSSKPLVFAGKTIDNFNLTFKDGKVVNYDAKTNIDSLKQLLETDEGSLSLGEVALVQHDSPISNSNILFYNTLFDENASCHLALGACYPTNVKGGTEISEDELYALGGNKSINHEDFMFGTSDMSVVGIDYNGLEIEIFKNGNFVF